jgi:hypothetical protein
LVTEIGVYVAPAGTVTVSDVRDADLTVALVAPKNTILLLTVVLKFAPVIITVVPMGPEFGENDVIVGGAATMIPCHRVARRRRLDIRKVFIVSPNSCFTNQFKLVRKELYINKVLLSVCQRQQVPKKGLPGTLRMLLYSSVQAG